MTYVRNAWYVAAWTDEIAIERVVGVRILNEPIVLWRNAAGQLAAFEDRCVHRLAPLSLGRCEGETLRCMYHGFLFDRTGRVVEIPGQAKIPSNLRVRTYPVVERYSWVWVWMGEAPADEAAIPPAVGPDFDRANYVFGRSQLDYVAEARLVLDNLLDLSHVSFVHGESLRLGATWAHERPKLTEFARGIHSERWFESEGPGGMIDADERVDSYSCVDYFVPGVVVLSMRTYPVGTAGAVNQQQPELNHPIEIVSHAVTPLTDKTTRYFYMVNDLRRGDETKVDMTPLNKAFAEDKTMIQAQQRNLDDTPERRFVATTADQGVLLFNRLVEKIEGEESRSVTDSS